MHFQFWRRNVIICSMMITSMIISLFSNAGCDNSLAQEGFGSLADRGYSTGTDAQSDALSDVDLGVKKEKEAEEATARANKNTAQLLVEDIQEVNIRIQETSTKIESINYSIAELDKRIEESEREYIEAEDRVKDSREMLGKALQMMYESTESDDLLSIILRADDQYDLINRGEYISSVSDYVNNKLESLQELLDEKEAQSDELINLKGKREDELIEYEEVQKELSDEMKELSSLMDEASKRAKAAEDLAKELAEEVAALEAKEREVLGRRIYTGENSNVVYDGDGTDYYYVEAYPYTEDELKILAAIIQAEAGSVSYPGMIAVGSVVMNRVADSRFPNTVAGVIYAPYQFEPVQIGTFAVILAKGPAEQCFQAAQEVLEGKRNVPNFYFKAAWYAEQHGISGVNIGGNVFH